MLQTSFPEFVQLRKFQGVFRLKNRIWDLKIPSSMIGNSRLCKCLLWLEDLASCFCNAQINGLEVCLVMMVAVKTLLSKMVEEKWLSSFLTPRPPSLGCPTALQTAPMSSAQTSQKHCTPNTHSVSFTSRLRLSNIHPVHNFSHTADLNLTDFWQVEYQTGLFVQTNRNWYQDFFYVRHHCNCVFLLDERQIYANMKQWETGKRSSKFGALPCACHSRLHKNTCAEKRFAVRPIGKKSAGPCRHACDYV